MAVKHCPHCGSDLAESGKGRSVPQLRRYFALVKAAYYHWPDAHEFEPDSKQHLRRWLQCKAGHHDTQIFELPETDDPVLMARMMEFAEALLDTDKGSKFGRWRGNVLAVFTPKSIRFDKLDHRAACQLFDEVAAVIEMEIGIPAERLLKEAETAA